MDLTDPFVITAQLARIGWRAHRGKRFGQNFLADRDALSCIIETLSLKRDDVVVEIGPGLGVLTVELCQRADRVIAVEKDAAVLPLLQENVQAFGDVTIAHVDALHFEISDYGLSSSGGSAFGGRITDYVLAGNLPYSITIPVIERFILESTQRPRRAVFLVQKEVGERLADTPGGAYRGAMTVLLEAVASVEIIAAVPAKSFFPAPEVDGVIIRITPRQDSQFAMLNSQFPDFIHSVFRYRRKQIGGIMPKLLDMAPVPAIERLSAIGIDPQARPQELTLSQWRSLFRHFVL